MIALRVSEDTEKRLAHIATATERSKSFHVRRALEAYLEDQEDYLLATAIKERVRLKKEKTYSLDEVETLLALHDA